MKGKPFHAVVGGARFLVRPAQHDEPGNFTLVLGEQRLPIDAPEDLLQAVPDGEAVAADFGAFSVSMWRDGADTWFRAAAGGVPGRPDPDLENACWALLDALGDARAPRACFFCKWSEVEPSTGWGNLGCAVAHAKEYEEVATSPLPGRRKWGPQSLLTWVDEWHACPRFTVRPKGYGYRGRP